METPSTEPQAVVGARTESATTQTSSTSQTKAKRKAGKRYEPDKLLQRSARLLTQAAATHDERCRRDAAPIPGQEFRLRAASGKLSVAGQRQEQAQQAAVPFQAEVAAKLIPIVALLRVTPGGSEVLMRMGERAPALKAQVVLERVQAGFEGLPATLVAQLESAVAAAVAAAEEVAAAKAGQRAAADSYLAAVAELKGQCSLVWATINRQRFVQRLAHRAS